VVVVPMGKNNKRRKKQQNQNHREIRLYFLIVAQGTTLCRCQLTFRSRIHLIVGHDDD
jgi:hypothetical protein